MERKQKAFEIKAASLEENILKGVASVMGVMDRGGDVIFPGAFKPSVLKRFLEQGFVPDTHAWNWESTVAMPRVARVQEGTKLYTEAEFHGTADAQSIRQKCRERIDRSLSVGLSIGFQIAEPGYQMYENGAALLKYAEENGHNLALFDVQAIKRCKTMCWGILEIEDLFEYSPCPVPMNPQAQATDVKSVVTMTEREFEAHLRDECGLSQREAKIVITNGFKQLLRDVETQEQPDPDAETPPTEEPPPAPETTPPSRLAYADALLREMTLRRALLVTS